MRAAVFLDRDGTVIDDVHYLSDPAQVRLIPGAADAIRALQALDYACVVVTNQSAVGRGMLTLDTLDAIHAEMHRQLHEQGVRLDGLYYCPVAPTVSDRRTIEHPDRKPGPGMLLRAAREMLLDLSGSWMVGDMLSDALAGRNAGCRGAILVRTGKTIDITEDPAVDYFADDLLDAAHIIARQHMLEPTLIPERKLT